MNMSVFFYQVIISIVSSLKSILRVVTSQPPFVLRSFAELDWPRRFGEALRVGLIRSEIERGAEDQQLSVRIEQRHLSPG